MHILNNVIFQDSVNKILCSRGNKRAEKQTGEHPKNICIVNYHTGTKYCCILLSLYALMSHQN